MRRRITLVSLLAVAVLSVGCSSAARQPAAPAGPAQPPSLATSLVTASGTWAVAVMGGSAASHNNFWQLFVRPAATGRWRLATPPGVASNGGLVLAGLGAGSVVAGFRPSQELSYSPLATTHDNGAAWTPGLLDAALADVPDALAAAPGSGRLLALLTSGGAELSGPGGTAWTRLATRRALAASAAGGRCGLGRLTAAAFSLSGPRCWPAAVPVQGPPVSSPTPAGRGIRPALRCPPRTPGRKSPCSGSPPHPAPPWRCWPRAPGQRHVCWPPRPPTAVPTGPCRSRSPFTAAGSPRHRSGPAALWRSC